MAKNKCRKCGAEYITIFPDFLPKCGRCKREEDLYKTSKQSGGKSSAKGSKNEDSKGGYVAIGIFGAIILVGYFIVITIFNFFRCTTVVDYGVAQYFRNIAHFHKNTYVKLSRSYLLFNGIKTINETEKKTDMLFELQPNQIVMMRGYARTGIITWLAVRLYNNDQEINGYIFIPKDIDYTVLAVNNEDGYWKRAEMDSVIEKQKKLYITEFNKAIKVTILKSNTEIQKLHEKPNYSSDFVELDEKYFFPYPKGNAVAVIINKPDFQKVENIYSKYLETDSIEKAFLRKI